MLGCFRLFLAALVALSHLLPNYGIPVPVINYGAAAVVCFYFISGYLMYLSFVRFRSHKRNPGRAFYADRLLRLYPSYFLAYAAASLWLYFGLGYNIFASFEWISEVLIIPANYTLMALPMPLAAAANPPTWSLGAECQFYLLLPLVMMAGRRTRVALLIVMIAGQLATMAVSAQLAAYAPWCSKIAAVFCYFPISDLLAYRWLPFAMTPFMLGVVVAEQAGERRVPWALTAAVVIYALAFVAAQTGLTLRNLSSREISSAMVLLVPVAYVILRRLSSRNSWDRFLGNLAYPLFLDHILCISITDRTATTGWRAAIVFTLLAFAVSVSIAAFQTAVDRWRYRQRGFGALARSQARADMPPQPAMEIWNPGPG